MARPLRLEFPGALYHVIARGNERAAFFREDEGKKLQGDKQTWRGLATIVRQLRVSK